MTKKIQATNMNYYVKLSHLARIGPTDEMKLVDQGPPGLDDKEGVIEQEAGGEHVDGAIEVADGSGVVVVAAHKLVGRLV